MTTISQALYEASLIYPQHKITREQLTAYAKRLSDLPEELVVQAIAEVTNTSEFFPSLAAIRNRATSIIGGDALVDPESAWGEVLKQARLVGAMREPTFSSPFIARAVESVGWREICLTDFKDHPTLRAQFRDSLRAIQNRARDGVVSGRVTASIDPALRSGSGAWKALGEDTTP